MLTKNEKGNQFMSAVFSCYWNENAIQQEWSNCFVSSIRLLVRFDWRNFAPPSPLGSPLHNFQLNYKRYWYSGTLSNVHHSCNTMYSRLFGIHIIILLTLKLLHKKVVARLAEHNDVIASLLTAAPRLGFALGSALTRAGPGVPRATSTFSKGSAAVKRLKNTVLGNSSMYTTALSINYRTD